MEVGRLGRELSRFEEHRGGADRDQRGEEAIVEIPAAHLVLALRQPEADRAVAVDPCSVDLPADERGMRDGHGRRRRSGCEQLPRRLHLPLVTLRVALRAPAGRSLQHNLVPVRGLHVHRALRDVHAHDEIEVGDGEAGRVAFNLVPAGEHDVAGAVSEPSDGAVDAAAREREAQAILAGPIQPELAAGPGHEPASVRQAHVHEAVLPRAEPLAFLQKRARLELAPVADPRGRAGRQRHHRLEQRGFLRMLGRGLESAPPCARSDPPHRVRRRTARSRRASRRRSPRAPPPPPPMLPSPRACGAGGQSHG